MPAKLVIEGLTYGDEDLRRTLTDLLDQDVADDAPAQRIEVRGVSYAFRLPDAIGEGTKRELESIEAAGQSGARPREAPVDRRLLAPLVPELSSATVDDLSEAEVMEATDALG